MSGRLRVGLVGAGRIVREAHVPAYLANRDVMDVVAVADPDQRNASAVGKALAVASDHLHPGLRELLDGSEVDLVVVATPSHEHHRAVVGALARGIGVVCEKPLCLDESELASIRSAAGDQGFVAVLHNYLAKPGWRHLIALIGEGRIGRPVMARFEELSDDHWRLPDETRTSWRERAEHGGGPLRDNLYHAFYLAEQILGSPLRRASGEQAALVHPYSSGDAAMVVAAHDNGALTQTTASWCHEGESRATVEVSGTKGTLLYRYWAEPDQLYLDNGGGTTVVRVPDWDDDLESGYVSAFRDVADRFRAGAPAPSGTADAERIMRVITQVRAATAGEENDG